MLNYFIIIIKRAEGSDNRNLGHEPLVQEQNFKQPHFADGGLHESMIEKLTFFTRPLLHR
jgi:hypothetical protein